MLGSQILVKTLAKAGVKKIFSLSGNQISLIQEAVPSQHNRYAKSDTMLPFFHIPAQLLQLALSSTPLQAGVRKCNAYA